MKNISFIFDRNMKNKAIIQHCDGKPPKIFEWKEESEENYCYLFGDLRDRGEFTVVYDILQIDMYSTLLTFPDHPSFFHALALASIFDDRFQKNPAFPFFDNNKNV